MAARTREQLDRFRAEVKKQESHLAAAKSRNEALNHAILAAEFTNKALKIALDPGEKADLKAQCISYLDQADQIKAAETWPPLGPNGLPFDHSGSPLIVNGANVLPKLEATEILTDAFANRFTVGKIGQSVPDAVTRPTSSSSPPPLLSASASMFSPPLSKETSQPWPVNSSLVQTNPSFAEKLDLGHADACTYPLANEEIPALSQTQTRAPSSAQHAAYLTGSNCPESISKRVKDIKSLKTPVSTRLLSKKEQIILLKASKVNGCVFPPWKEPPDLSEFVLEDQAEPFLDAVELKLSSHQMDHFISWTRARDALPPPSWFPGHRRDLFPVMQASGSVDLVQDAATDCSVVASLCAGIARTERGHDSVFRQMLWPNDRTSEQPIISSNGKYIIRLNFNGCWRKVIIDDRLPLSRSNRTLHVVDRKNSGLLWPALLEKAYLKVRGGYDFPGSNSCSDLWALTGWIPEQIYLQEGDLVPSQLWTRLYKAFLYGDVLVTLGTSKMSHRAERELGLESQHSYVILDMKENDHEKAFLVKNPWLEGKGWKGRRPSSTFLMEGLPSDETPLNSNNSMKPNSKYNPYPSTFWIGLDSVVQHFESLYLNWNTGLFSYRQDIHFSWNLMETSAASGCVADHPQFSFSSDNGGIVWMVLSRHFRDTPPDAHNQSDAFNDGTVRSDQETLTNDNPLKGYMNIYIYDRQGVRIFVKDNYIERGQYVNTPQSLLRWECLPRSTYTLVIDQEELLASSYSFTLSAFSNSAITLGHARQKYPFEKKVSGSWTSESAGGNTHSSKYFDNPQYSLAIGYHTALAILIQTRNGHHPVHVKLVHGHGKRIHSIQSRDILVDSGEHRDGCALAEVNDVLPGTYTIICSLFEAAKKEEFSLTVYTTSGCDIRPIPRDGAGLVSTRLANACFNSLVHKVAAPLVPRRITAITVIVKFLYARKPGKTTGQGNDVKNCNPLRILIETGRGPEKALLAGSENGDFGDTGAVRIQNVNLRPDMLYNGDIWLVLERLSSPGSAVEEWYEVEILADAPQAFSTDLWRVWDD